MIEISILSPLASRHQKGKRLKEVPALCHLLIVIVVVIAVGWSIRGAYAKGR
jgi:hypothetical protein